MKLIRIEFPNGDVFNVTAKEIALDRTNHYMELVNFRYKSGEWHDEFEQSMEDYILIDWVMNMNWGKLHKIAIKENTPAISYDTMLQSAKFEIR